MNVELRKPTSAKTRRSSASLNFKARLRLNTKKNEDDIKADDVFTTFQYKKEAAGDSDEADTVFIFPRNWPEWSDYELNTEAWRNEDVADKQRTVDFFHDPEGVLLPRTQMRKLDCWKRPHEAFQSPCILYDDTVPCIDIISANKHLLSSRCMRWVISSITMVQKLAEDAPFTIEGGNPQYIPNGGTPWRPWHHIYSLCKAGDVPHRPLINPSGKYVIRLYYLGCWRKLAVDDSLPFDSKGKMLLPASTINGELWPMLIAKALLKIASHTWNEIEDPSGFQPITCLTGWMCEEFTNVEFDNFKLWKLISGILEEKEEILVKEEPSAVQKPPVESSKKANKKEKEKSPKKAKSKSTKQNPEIPELPKKIPKTTEVLGVLSYWSEKYDASEVVQQIFPLKDPSQEIRIAPADDRLRTMNFPVLFQGYEEKNKSCEMNTDDDYPWKKNLRKSQLDEQKFIPESYVKAYSHFFGMKQDTVSAPESEMAASPPEEVIEKDSKKKSRAGKKEPKEKAKSPTAGKKPAKGKGTPVKNPVNTGPMMIDSGKWISFDSLTALLEGIILIHKPALFKSRVQKPDFSRLLAPQVLSESDNLEDIDEESELCLEFAVEEKSFIYLDSAEEVDLIMGLFMLPTPTKLEENYSTAFDLMLNACEGNDDEYINYRTSRSSCDAQSSNQKKIKVINEPCDSNEKYFDQWIEYNDDITYELDGNNERHFLCDHTFVAKDGLMIEINVDVDGDDDSENSEWECDEYELKLYKFGETIQKGCEGRSSKYFDAQRQIPESLNPALLNQTFLGKKNILYNVLNTEPQINTFLLSNKLQASKECNFKTFEDIETFYGHPTMTHQPESLRNSTYLGIEKYRWDKRNTGHPEMQFDVINGKTIHIALPPGRHIFQLLIRSPTFHCLHMLSNVEIFYTIAKSDLFTLMKEDCAVLASYENAVHQRLEKLVSSVHDGGFSKARRALLNSYLPRCYGELPKDEKEFVHKAFKESMKKSVMENISKSDQDNACRALKILFLDAELRNDGKYKVASEYDFKRSSSQKRDSKWQRKMTQSLKEEEAAKKIQRFFKGFLARKLFLCLRKDKELISRTLDNLNVLLKSNKNIQIMRTMMNEEPKLKDTYGLLPDLVNEVNLYEWRGLTLEINKDNWIPLIRYVFQWNSNQEIMSFVSLTCPLEHWVLTITDNDSGEEIQRINNYSIPHSFKNNEKGYTVFAYGLDEFQSWSTVPWKVNQVVPKSSPPLLISHSGILAYDAEKIPKLRADTLFGYYIPNSQKRVCSFLMKVKESCQISLCFNTSDRHVVFKFTLIDENLEKIIDQEKEGLLVVPTIFLDGPADNEEYEVYIGEATLLNNWQLTDFQKTFAENQWIKDVAYSKASPPSTSPTQARTMVGKSILNDAKLPRPSLMETKLTMGELLTGQVISQDSYPATWRLEVLLNSPQEVVLEEIKPNGDQLKNKKKEWEGSDPELLQKNAELLSNSERNGFSECLDYSKKVPTKFKTELPYFEEFHEKDSDDEASGDMKPNFSSIREQRKSSTQKRSHRSKKKRTESEVGNEENSTMRSLTIDASISEKGDATDGEAEFFDFLSEISVKSSARKTEMALIPENLIGHSCHIDTTNIAGFKKVLGDTKKSINLYFSQDNLEINDEILTQGIKFKRKSTDVSLYDAIYKNKSENDLKKEDPENKGDSLTSAADEILPHLSSHKKSTFKQKSTAVPLYDTISENKSEHNLTKDDSENKEDSLTSDAWEILPKSVSDGKSVLKRKSTAVSLPDQIQENKSEYNFTKESPNDKMDSLTSDAGEILPKSESIFSRIHKEFYNAETLTEMTNAVETLPKAKDKDDEEISLDHYKRYYINNYDSTSSTSTEESSETSLERQKVMTINDWVKIQSKTAIKQERFKKKLYKLFIDVDYLVKAPFDRHLEKWNMYMANAWRSSSEAFTDTEKPLDAHRRAKKKLEIIRKERIKEDMKIIRILKGGKPKKGKTEKIKKPKKEKEKKQKDDVTNIDEEEEQKGKVKNKAKKAK